MLEISIELFLFSTILATKPLENLIPVDEFLPIMFNEHPNATWKQAFPNRNLIAWSAVLRLLFPMRYTHDDGYVSDTEHSDLIDVSSRLRHFVQKRSTLVMNNITTAQKMMIRFSST